MYVDPQKARQERERLERERQAKIQAEKERKARLKAEEERKAKAERDRKARIKAEEERKAKLKAEQKDPNKKADPKPEAKKPTQPKTEGKKPQAEKKPDDKSQTEITWSKTGQTNPIYGSSAPIYSQGSVPIATGSTPDTKPKVPLNRPPRTWTGETAEETKPEAKSEHKPYKPRDFSSAKAKIAEGRALKEQKKQEQLKSTLKQEPGVSEILKQPSFLNGALTFGSGLFNPNLGETFVGGSKGLTQSEQPNQPETKKESKPSGGGGFWNGALNFGTNLAGDIVNIGKTVLDTGVTGISAIAKTIPQPLLNATNPALFASTVLTGAGAISANATQPPKEDGGWFGKAMNFGNTLVSGAKSVGQSALDMGSNAYNGAANWVSDHKAEIAIGVGIVALGAATVLTGGAALAIVGGGGFLAGASGGALTAGLLAGGAIGGAAVNTMIQGGQLKDHAIDPATGKPKTDFSFREMGTAGLTGMAMAPLAIPMTAGAVALPTVTALAGVGLSVPGAMSAHDNWQAGNKTTAVIEGGLSALSILPFMSKGGNNPLGPQARGTTMETLGKGANAASAVGDTVGQAIFGPKLQPAYAPVGGGIMPVQGNPAQGSLGQPLASNTTNIQTSRVAATTGRSSSSEPTAAPSPQSPQSKAPTDELISRYPKAQAKLEKLKPEVRERLKGMQPDELETALADPKMLDKTISKAKVAGAVEGKKIKELTPALRDRLDNHYETFQVNGKWMVRQRDGQGLNLHVDKDGIIQSGSANNVNPLRVNTSQMKKTLTDSGVDVIDGQPVHHNQTIESAGKDPLVKGAVNLERHDINNAGNLGQLPKDSASRKLFPKEIRDLLPEHGPDNYHPKWRKHVIDMSKEKLGELRRKYKIPQDMTNEDAVNLIHQKHPGALKKAVEELQPILRDDLLKDGNWIRYNENEERILASNSSDEKDKDHKSSAPHVLNA